jgi:ribosomal protein S12
LDLPGSRHQGVRSAKDSLGEIVMKDKERNRKVFRPRYS